ncbi:MAG: ABC transporter ATP-binding protein [Propionibacteriaceae bacterium]
MSTTTGLTLAVTDLSVSYGSKSVVRGVTFGVESGETVGLIGDSGSGKSTIIKSLLGLLPTTASTEGLVEFKGQSILGRQHSRSFRALLLEEIGLVPQAAMNSLDPVVRVDDHFHLAMRQHRRTTRREARGAAAEALERVGISGDRARAYPHQLSGGMRQRVLIAMATMLEPSLLIADEPTTGLDVVVQDRVLETMVRSKEELGHSLLLVTHDLEVARAMCDRIVRLADGQVIAQGTPAELDLGTSSDSPPGPVSGSSERPALVIRDLSVALSQGRGFAAQQRSGMSRIVEDVSLAVQPGEILGVTGESGCGKSTLLATLAGVVVKTHGEIELRQPGGDRIAVDRHYTRAARRSIQMVFQDPYDSLNPRFTVASIVAEPLIAQDTQPPPGEQVESFRRRRVAETLRAVELDPNVMGPRYPAQLSGGERQRVAIARALVGQPSVLLADEPVSMLDDATAGSIVQLLRRLAREMGVAIVLVTHSTRLLRDHCDRVGVMYLGRLVEIGTGRELFTAPRHPYTRALMDAAVAPGQHGEDDARLHGEPPSMLSKPSGCVFHPRCPVARPECSTSSPDLGPDGVACFFPIDADEAGTLASQVRTADGAPA